MNRIISKPFAALVLVLGLLGGCASQGPLEEPPRISMIGLKPVEIGLLEQRYSVRLRVQNPNRTDLGIQGMNYSIEVNEREFARGVSDKEVLIPAFGEGIVEVSVISNLSSIIRQLKLLGEKGTPISYRISGRIALKGIPGTIPFAHEGRLLLGDAVLARASQRSSSG